MTAHEALNAWISDYYYGEVSVETLQADTLAGVEALAAAGYVIVPKEPTEAMIVDGHAETPYCVATPDECHKIIGDRSCHEATAAVWRSMVAAAGRD